MRGHIAARSSDDVLRQLAAQLKRSKIEHAATGLAGAWLLNQFAGFRLVVFYVGQMPSAEAQQGWVFTRKHEARTSGWSCQTTKVCFTARTEREGIRCAHPVQVYLDLKNHPERSAEAAEQLRRKFLSKDSHA